MKRNATLLLILASALYAHPLWAQCPASADAGPDIYVCTPPAPAKAQLNGSVAGQFVYTWLPSVPSAVAKTLDPTVALNQTTTYILTADALDPNAPNLVVNGDFEQGNAGFTTGLTYAPGSMGNPLDTYDVMPFDPPYMPKHDHTTGDGNLFAAKLSKSGQPTTVWCQTIPVVPDKFYAIEFFTAHPYPYAPIHNRGHLFMDGLRIYTGTWDGTGQWIRHHLLWNSGITTSVEMCIVHDEHIKVPVVIGLDDISLRPTCKATDSVTVHLTKLSIAPPTVYALPCPGALLTLNATVNTSKGANITYNWETASGNIVSGQNSLMPVVDAAGDYALHVHYESSTHTCDLETDFNVKPLLLPLATISSAAPLDCAHPQTTLVGATNMPAGLVYEWTAAAGGHIVGGATTNAITVDQGGVYQLTATNPATGCSATAEHVLAPPPVLPIASASSTNISPNQPVASLYSTGSSAGANIIYAWTTPNGNITSGQSAQNATASLPGMYILTVRDVGTGCKAVDTTLVLFSNSQCTSTVSAGPDIYACKPPGPATVELHAEVSADVEDFLWLPPVPAGIKYDLDPVVKVNAPVSTYIIKAFYPDYTTNLIANGDFEEGNASFVSGAAYSPGDLSFPLTYDVVSNPQDANPNYLPCMDHTTGQGNMLVVHPDQNTGLSAWCQTVAVEPGKLYYLSFYVNRIMPFGITSLNLHQLFVDGILISGSPSLNSNICTWQEIKGKWYSGNSTSVEVCIEANPIQPPNPDKFMLPFAVDDITMYSSCAVTDSVKVFLKALTIAPSANLIVPCPGLPTTIDATTGSSTGDFISYEWSTSDGNIVSGANTLTPAIDQAGSYWLDLTFQSSTHTCALQTGFVATAAPALLVNILQTQPLTCYTPSITLKALPNYPNDLTYAWSADLGGNIVSGANTATPLVNQPGTYIVTITNTKTGCTATAEQSVNPPESPPLANATSTNISPAQPVANLYGTGSSTGANIAYAWTTPNGNITAGQKAQNATASLPGMYILTVKNTITGCTAVDTTIVLFLSSQCPVTVDAGPDIYACAPPGPAFIQLNAEMSGTPTNFEWLSPVPSPMNKTLNPAFAVSAPFSIFVFTATTVDSGNNLIANGDFEQGAGTFTSSLNYSPGDLTLPNTYDVLTNPKDANIDYSACTDHTTGQGNMLAAHPIAQGTQGVWSQTVIVSPNTHYSLSFFASRLTPGAPSNNLFRLLMNGVLLTEPLAYFGNCTWTEVKAGWDSGSNTSVEVSIEVTSIFPNGHVKQLQAFAIDDITMYPSCTVSDSVNVFVKALAIAPLTNLEVPCAGSPITINATSGTSSGNFITYAWNTLDGNIVSGANTLMPTVDQAGTYSLDVQFQSSTHNCEIQKSFLVAEAPPLTSTILQPKPLSCSTPSVILKAVPNDPQDIAYSWAASSSGNIVSGANTATPLVDQPGTYTVTITNTKTGCTATAERSVDPPEPPPFADATATNITCAQAQAQLSGEGSSSGPSIFYLWTAATGPISSQVNATTNSAGTYVLQVLNTATGCKTYDTVQVTKNLTKPTLALTAPGLLKCGKPDTLALSANVLPANAALAWAATNGGNILSGAATAAPKVNATGTYTLTATDPANGCTATASVTVKSTVNLNVVTAPAPPLTCAQPSLALNAAGTTTGPNIQYLWTTTGGLILSGNTGLAPTIAAPGTYHLLVTDTLSGCAKTLDVKILAEKTAPQAQAAPAPHLFCGKDEDIISATRLDTLPNVAIQWTTTDGNILAGADSLAVTVNAGGTYTLTLTNLDNGCTTSLAVPVTASFQPPAVQIAAPSALTCTTLSLDLSATATSASGHIAYDWFATGGGHIVSGAMTAAPKIDQPGAYTIVVHDDDNGCSATAVVFVALDRQPPALSIAPATALTCAVTTLDLSATASGGNPQYAWVASGGGNILSGSGTAAPKIDQPGTYALTVTDLSNGCTATAETTVSANTALPQVDAGPVLTLTCTTAAAALSGSGSTGPGYSYLWTTTDGNIVSGDNTLTPTVNAAGTYTLQIVDNQNGCSATDPVLVQKEANVPAAQIQPPATLDCLAPTVQLNAIGTSQGADITFTWATVGGNFLSGQNTLTPTVNAPGQYTLSVLNTASNCAVSTTVTVPENRVLPIAQVAAPAQINCLNTALTLDASGSSGGSNYALAWTVSGGGNIVSGNTGLSPTVNAAGIYALLITDPSNGCTATASVTVTANTALPQAEAGPSAELTCTTITLALSGSGSTDPNFSYLWTTVDGNIVSGEKTLTPTVSVAGTYTLQVIDSQSGCAATDTVLVQKNANVPDALAQTPGLLTCKTASLTLASSGTSQGPDFTYLWTASNGGNIVSGNTTLAPDVNQPGTYTLLVSNTINGCTAVVATTVLEDRAPPTAAATAPTVIDCKNPSVALSGNGSSTGSNFAYTWVAGGGGNIVSGNTTLAPDVNQPGTYTLLVTNTSNGCTNTAAATVLLDKAAPTAQVAAAPQLNCTVNSLILNGNNSSQGANMTYLWSASSGGNIVSGNTTLAPDVNQPGTYTLLVTNLDNGCTATASVAVSRDVALPIAAVAPPAMLNCTVTSLALDGSKSSQGANFTYNWTAAGGGNIVSGNTTLAPDVNQPGTYNLLITNTKNTCTATASVAVAQDLAKPQVTTFVPSMLDCATQALSLSASVTGAGSSFESTWTTADGLILSGSTTLTPSIGAAGTYTVLIKNLSNGCTQTATAQVLKDVAVPLSAAASPAELTCKTAQVALSGAGSSTGSGIAYQWSAASGTGIVSGNTTLAPTVSKPGVYTLVVTNTANHCTATATTTVLQNIQPPQANAGAGGLLTCTTKQLSLAGSGTGGASGVAYAWAGAGIQSGANTAAPLVTSAGIYALTVTDQYNGCTATSQTTVGQDVAPPVGGIAPPAVLDCLAKTVALSGSVSTPASGYSVTWTGAGLVSGASTLAPTVNQPGIYALHITNSANGCTASATASVSQNIELPVAKASGGFELNCTVLQGTLSAAGSSAGANFQYAWAAAAGGGNIVSGGNSATPVVNAPGTYTLTVSNLQNHCTASQLVQVTQNTNVPTALALDEQPPNCKKPTGSVRVTAVTGGTGPYLYSLDGGTTFGSASLFNQLAPGSYALVVQDVNGCEHEQALSFDTPVQPTVTLGPDVRLVFGEAEKLTAVVNLPPDQIASVTWSPMEGLTLTADLLVVIAKPLRSTYYTVTVVNKEGCEAKVSLRAQVDDPHLWAPNVFSPGRRDGDNDFFLLFASDNSVQKVKTLQIFDRWGTMIFRNDDLLPNVEKMGWDGSFRGQTVQPAVFAWYAEVLLANGELVLMKGDVTVVD